MASGATPVAGSATSAPVEGTDGDGSGSPVEGVGRATPGARGRGSGGPAFTPVPPSACLGSTHPKGEGGRQAAAGRPGVFASSYSGAAPPASDPPSLPLFISVAYSDLGTNSKSIRSGAAPRRFRSGGRGILVPVLAASGRIGGAGAGGAGAVRAWGRRGRLGRDGVARAREAVPARPPDTGVGFAEARC